MNGIQVIKFKKLICIPYASIVAHRLSDLFVTYANRNAPRKVDLVEIFRTVPAWEMGMETSNAVTRVTV